MKIRRLANEERPTTSWRLQSYAFEPSPTQPDEVARFHDFLPYLADSITLVVQDGDETLAAVSAIPMRQNVRGVVHPMAGISGVASHPLARRQGHVRTLLTQLLGELRDEGYAVSSLYPFRPSFYARFGYAALPQPRTVSFSPADLGEWLRADLPGELRLQRIRDGYDTYRGFTERLVASRHGFCVLPDSRAVHLRDDDKRWLVSASHEGEVIGAVTYRIDDHGGTLRADDLLTVGPLGRALLLQFFARHVDQVARISAIVAADETPELWAADLATHTESTVAFPGAVAPMARLLTLDGLHGLPTGPGRVRVEIVDDPLLAGSYLLDGTDGQLTVSRADAPALPAATLTAAGISALVYGVADPDDLPLRGFGTVPPSAATQLRSLFPRTTPHLSTTF
ncbi:GNAT family N-acetyltransferase [Micromonospora sp. NBC_01699]|uniref:GNAT family N-acetyltransferase n=1 Tax=Micromonospora sp. NBC_01699 TaxID=2975984 RepID=UPI002E2ECB58|nr:GNAT family N-acetyltransferase [Micromonospora sp. NBC_01699]